MQKGARRNLDFSPARVAGSDEPAAPTVELSSDAGQARTWLASAMGIDSRLLAPVPARAAIRLASAVAELLQLAEVDELTGTLRRGAGERALQREIARARRVTSPLTIVFIDVDGLKAVNDTAGHSRGDALLRDLAAAIRQRLRPYDLFIRWGGDEFVCVLVDCDPEAALSAMDEAEDGFRARTGGSFSVGCAALGADLDAAELVLRADRSLYYTKARRRSAGKRP